MTSPGSGHLPKNELRRRLRAARPDPASQSAQSAAIRGHLLDWLRRRGEKTIALFAPLPGEPDLLDLTRLLPEKRWLLPRIDGQTLAFHSIGGLHALPPGPFGIAEPPADCPCVKIREIDHFLCPGLGFAPDGARLGRGKGYYDRALSAARTDAFRTGAAFHEQLVDAIPAEPHDLPMHHLATPDGILPCG